jgi:hypothetical protein
MLAMGFSGVGVLRKLIKGRNFNAFALAFS